MRKSIESAPKDGTKILAWNKENDPYIVTWEKFPEGSVLEGDWRIKGTGGRDPILYLTKPLYWAPIPEYYELEHEKHGMGGLVRNEPKPQEQDKEFLSLEQYAVVWFPKYAGLPPARLTEHHLHTISRTPQLAIEKFMERIAPSETWESYKKAGYMVRKIKIIDLGAVEEQQ